VRLKPERTHSTANPQMGELLTCLILVDVNEDANAAAIRANAAAKSSPGPSVELVERIKAHIAKGDKAKQKSEEHYCRRSMPRGAQGRTYRHLGGMGETPCRRVEAR